MKKVILYILIGYFPPSLIAQNNPPWERPLKIAWSSDGTSFYNESIFQDSSGVPSAIRWKGDTMVCVFQWFRAPVGSLTWDRVAVKFSYNNGSTWTAPVPIIVNGLPPNYQRPFDPTLARLNSDSLRIYFSSSNGMPPLGSDSIINTYSALSTDGITYNFEPGPRFDHPTNKAIDPAVLFFNGQWHYSCPIGAPQAGAFHATSADGLNFMQQPDYPSDPAHNWTGNMLYESNTLMKFYGSGPSIWHNSTTDGFTWTGYTNTNLIGGDPSAMKVTPNSYFIIYVGMPNVTGVNEHNPGPPITIYPNPVQDYLLFQNLTATSSEFKIIDCNGRLVKNGSVSQDNKIRITELNAGVYLIELKGAHSQNTTFRFIKY